MRMVMMLRWFRYVSSSCICSSRYLLPGIACRYAFRLSSATNEAPSRRTASTTSEANSPVDRSAGSIWVTWHWPDSTNGVWFEFEGARWYSDGAAVVYDARRFERAAELFELTIETLFGAAKRR